MVVSAPTGPSHSRVPVGGAAQTMAGARFVLRYKFEVLHEPRAGRSYPVFFIPAAMP
jgi:hypothetical protein